MRKLLSILLLILFIGSVSALTIRVTPKINNDYLPDTLFDYQINLTTNADCTGVVATNTTEVKTDHAGIAYITIDTSSLTSIPNYLCEYRDGILRSTIQFEDIIFNSIYANNLNISGTFQANNITAEDSLIVGTDTARDPTIYFMSAGTDGSLRYEDTGDTFHLNHGLYIEGTNGFLDVATKGLFGEYVSIDEYLTVGGFANITGVLNVSSDSYFGGDLIPFPSLTHDIGSGTNRWNNIYGTNLSIDYIDAANDIVALGNITADYFHGSELYVTVINVTNLTMADDLNLLGYTITANVLEGVVGGMSMAGDPWWLYGTDLQIEQSLIVDENVTADWFNGLWNGSSDYFTSAEVLAFDYYNSTDFSISDYYTKTQIDNFNYYNATDFNINDYYTSSEVEGIINNGTYIIDNILNNGTYSAVDTDTFVANYTDFRNKIEWSHLINGTYLGEIWGTLGNGTMVTSAELNNGTYSAVDTDTFVANYSTFLTHATKTYVDEQNTSQTNYIGTVNDSMGNYVDSQDLVFNTTMENYVGEVNTSMGNYVDAMDLIFNNSIVNWIQDQFYTKTEVDDINTSMKNYADGTFVDVAGDNMTGVLNTTAGINLENNASISRSETDTKTWISESGNWITQFGT